MRGKWKSVNVGLDETQPNLRVGTMVVAIIEIQGLKKILTAAPRRDLAKIAMRVRYNKETSKITAATIGEVALALLMFAFILLILDQILGSKAYAKLSFHMFVNYPVAGWLVLGILSGWRFRSRMRSYRETSDQVELSWVLMYGVFILISVVGFAFVVLSTVRRYVI